MNLPGFTGDASLCQTNRHYWTGRNSQAIHLPAPTIETIHPAREEVIEVHSCPPGYNDWGGTCYPVLTEINAQQKAYAEAPSTGANKAKESLVKGALE